MSDINSILDGQEEKIYFAHINSDSIVDQVHSIAYENTLDENGEFSENIAIKYLSNFFNTDENWIRTYKESRIRYHFAGIGFMYDSTFDAFIPPKPGDNYILWADMKWISEEEASFIDVSDLDSLFGDENDSIFNIENP